MGRYHLQARSIAPLPTTGPIRNWMTQEEFDDKAAALWARLERVKTHPSYEWLVLDTQADHSEGPVSI